MPPWASFFKCSYCVQCIRSWSDLQVFSQRNKLLNAKLLSSVCRYCMWVHEKCKHRQSKHQILQTVVMSSTLTCPLQVSGCHRLVHDLLLVAACQIFMLFLYV